MPPLSSLGALLSPVPFHSGYFLSAFLSCPDPSCQDVGHFAMPLKSQQGAQSMLPDRYCLMARLTASSLMEKFRVLNMLCTIL